MLASFIEAMLSKITFSLFEALFKEHMNLEVVHQQDRQHHGKSNRHSKYRTPGPVMMGTDKN